VAISEAQRADLYTGLAEVLGPDRAELLMTQLPRYDVEHVATHADVVALRSDMGDLRSGMGDLRSEMGDLRSEMGDLRSELRSEMGELRSELRSEMGELRSEFRSEMGVFRDGLAAVNQRLDRLFLALVAGLFVVIAAMASVILVIA
jgi:predicted nuclease with TOPRIM domain